jgi:hypothetical protein
MRIFDLPRATRHGGQVSANHIGAGHPGTYSGDDARTAIIAEQMLDHALEDTFPASDPLSSNRFN